MASFIESISIFGLISLGASIVFFIVTNKATKVNKEILDKINKAIDNWQSKIMDATIEILQSRPDIIVSRERLENTKAKNEVLHDVLEKAKYILQQPFSEKDSVSQTARLNMLFNTVINIIKSDIPPEVYVKLAERQAKTHPDITNDEHKHSKND